MNVISITGKQYHLILNVINEYNRYVNDFDNLEKLTSNLDNIGVTGEPQPFEYWLRDQVRKEDIDYEHKAKKYKEMYETFIERQVELGFPVGWCPECHQPVSAEGYEHKEDCKYLEIKQERL